MVRLAPGWWLWRIALPLGLHWLLQLVVQLQLQLRDLASCTGRLRTSRSARSRSTRSLDTWAACAWRGALLHFHLSSEGPTRGSPETGGRE